MKKYLYFFLVVLLVVSISFNFTLNIRLKAANNKITEINENTAIIVERNIRQSIVNTRELIETNSKESLFGLQRTIEDLTLSFGQWYKLNDSEELPNSTMQRGLSGIEAIRNLIIHHLNRQYISNGEQLKEEDIEMLERFHEIMNRLLLAYHNIDGKVINLKSSGNSDATLTQLASNLEELSRLYRHSSTPNRHPDYIGIEVALKNAKEQLVELNDYKLEAESGNVFIKDGVHYYQANFIQEDELVYTVYIDAIDGTIRNLEYKITEKGNEYISKDESLVIARNFLNKFYVGDVQEEMLYIKNDSDNSSLYSFRFIPIREELKIVSDAYIINVCPHSGKVVKYINDFNDTTLTLLHEQSLSVEDVLSKYSNELGEMTYEGQVIVKSFNTRFKPTLAYSFNTRHNEQQLTLYYDVNTGRLIHQMYHIYEQI